MSDVFTCPAEGVCEGVVCHVRLAEAEVDELDVSLLVEHDVLGLEVAVDDVEAVQVLQGQDDLLQVELGHRLHHQPLHLHPPEQLAAAAKLLHQVQPLRRLEGELQSVFIRADV